jgi:hypothetical protein
MAAEAEKIRVVARKNEVSLAFIMTLGNGVIGSNIDANQAVLSAGLRENYIPERCTGIRCSLALAGADPKTTNESA